jgi:hypothetical protein
MIQSDADGKTLRGLKGAAEYVPALASRLKEHGKRKWRRRFYVVLRAVRPSPTSPRVKPRFQ